MHYATKRQDENSTSIKKVNAVIATNESYKQIEIKRYENAGKAGACISLTGEIQAYNAVIKDLKRINLNDKEKQDEQ